MPSRSRQATAESLSPRRPPDRTRPPAAEQPAGPIDHAHLARYTFGNRALEVEVLKLFAGQAPETLAQLQAAATEKAWREAAHTLKGSARAVGAFAVAERAERAEALTASTDAEERRRAVEATAEALAAACRYIDGLGVPD
jgi:HPt (histidine-containing phosphotransfer) domain-containing protein